MPMTTITIQAINAGLLIVLRIVVVRFKSDDTSAGFSSTIAPQFLQNASFPINGFPQFLQNMKVTPI